MAYDYDKLYGSTPQALGKPTQIFVDFFEQHAKNPQRVLDIGCGQGRDALFIAGMGHNVVGVDISANGVRDMVDAANQQSLSVKGIIADIVEFVPTGEFDVILIDRTLHMLREKHRLDVLNRLILHVAPDGWVLIADESSNIKGFKDIFAASDEAWETKLDSKGYLFVQRS